MADTTNRSKTVGDLKATNGLYSEYVNEWMFLMAAYEGTRSLILAGYLTRHERESLVNWQRRMKTAYGFGYSRSVVDLFNFYLFKEPVKRTLASLQEDGSWTAFMEDCNLYDDSFDYFMTEQSRMASIQGFMGILIDKSTQTFETVADELKAEVYPYVAAYFPTNILDWEYNRDDNNRPYLEWVKLLDTQQRSNWQYRYWFRDRFEVWEIPEVNEKNEKISDETTAKLVHQGRNPLGEVPFVWLHNMRSTKMPLGVGDIGEVARIDVSILRNLSQGEEVVDYAAFPMMRKPMQEQRPDGAMPSQKDEVGTTAVLEFDPDHPESKPDWLSSEVEAPIGAILSWIERKVAEIYRATNVGGMASMEISTAPKSGAALKAEFQLLNSNLVRKAQNLEKAERDIISFWLKWQSKGDLFKEVTIERSRTYDVENLAADLENSLTSTTIVRSKKFSHAIQKAVARKMLPAYTDAQMGEIDKEIEEAPTAPVGGGAFGVPIGEDNNIPGQEG